MPMGGILSSCYRSPDSKYGLKTHGDRGIENLALKCVHAILKVEGVPQRRK